MTNSGLTNLRHFGNKVTAHIGKPDRPTDAHSGGACARNKEHDNL